jgi:cytochrome c-type biogenesis protein CcmF
MISAGTYGLSLAVLMFALAALSSLAVMRLGSATALVWARRFTLLGMGCVTLASWALLTLLVRSDFSVAYVAGYSERALPLGYKLAAFWAGQEGSLLLWGWLLAAMSAVLAYQRHDRSDAEQAAAIGVMAVVTGFFAAMMVFAADPFALSPERVSDGHGLNPLLQHPSMIAHPPMLFVGYAGFTVPFALLVAAVVTGRRDNLWIAATRRWLLLSWVFLTVGILLGAQWAYLELGWGGYWAWDPVENASLLPWLTGTALLHSVIVQQQRGMFKRWNAWLIAGTFLLCIFGTYLTRSGVIQSVHAFPKSLIGQMFLYFLLVATAATIALLALRNAQLAPDRPMEELVSKDGFVLAANALLVIMTVVTAVGTIFPLISGLFVNEPITVKPPFYNKVVAPMGLMLAGLMSVGPLLTYGKLAGAHLVRGLIVPGGAAVIAMIAMAVTGVREPWALACTAIVTVAVCSVSMQLLITANERARQNHEVLASALLNTIDDNHRRYGGQFVHLGVVMMVAGICGSSLFGVDKTLKLNVGQTAGVGEYTVTYSEALKEVRGANYTAVQAHITVTDKTGYPIVLDPQKRFYDKSKQGSFDEVALATSLSRDVYVTLAGWEANGASVALHVMINPLVLWIWLGGIVMTLGGVFCILPRLMPASTGRRASLPIGTGSCSGGLRPAAK